MRSAAQQLRLHELRARLSVAAMVHGASAAHVNRYRSTAGCNIIAGRHVHRFPTHSPCSPPTAPLLLGATGGQRAEGAAGGGGVRRGGGGGSRLWRWRRRRRPCGQDLPRPWGVDAEVLRGRCWRKPERVLEITREGT